MTSYERAVLYRDSVALLSNPTRSSSDPKVQECAAPRRRLPMELRQRFRRHLREPDDPRPVSEVASASVGGVTDVRIRSVLLKGKTISTMG